MRLLALSVLLLCLAAPVPASAAPAAHIVSLVPPRSADDEQVVTTLIDLSDSRSIASITKSCEGMPRARRFECMSSALERPFALFSPYPFPAGNAVFTMSVGGVHTSVPLVSATSFHESRDERAGTAWLLLLDVDRRMGKSQADALRIAEEFLSRLGARDVARIVLFDRQQSASSAWSRVVAPGALRELRLGMAPRHAGEKGSLSALIRAAAADGFRALDELPSAPLHRALVVLSNGVGGSHPTELSRSLSSGRLHDDPARLPTPVSVVSMYFPSASAAESDAGLELMQGLVEPSLGGYFRVVNPGRGRDAPAIVSAVRQRFAKMHVVKWRTACLTPGQRQTFKLLFVDVNPSIAPDESFRDVPVAGAELPLVLDSKLTTSGDAGGVPVKPGHKLHIPGEFCASSRLEEVQTFFDPGDEELSAGAAAARWKERGIAGKSLELSADALELLVPPDELIVLGSGPHAKVRFVLWDERAQRVSQVIELPAQLAPQAAAFRRLGERPVPLASSKPTLRAGALLSVAGGAGTALGAPESVDGDAYDYALALRGGYMTRGGYTFSLSTMQHFNTEGDNELTTSRAAIQAGLSLPVARSAVEPYVAVGGALVRRFGSALQAAGSAGLVATLPLSRGVLLTCNADALIVVPKVGTAVTMLIGIGVQP